jgi:thioredoxin reductase
MVTGWAGIRSLELTSPSGRSILDADAVVLATGARERARAARRIPGDRPTGIYTTGQLQNAVYLHGQKVGSKAVIVGAEAVSWSAALTLRHAGCEPLMLTSEYPQAEVYSALSMVGKLALHVGLRTRTRVTKVLGRGRVSGVEVLNLDTGAREVVACDTVVFTADWIPDNELVRTAGITLNNGTLGPAVDTALRTSREGVFAVGNLTHPVDTADIAALDGAHVASSVLSHLREPQVAREGLEIIAAAPFRWVTPSIMRPGDSAPPRGRLLLWSDEFRQSPSVLVQQADRTVAAQRLPWPAAPGRVFRLPWRVMRDVSADDGPVTIRLG